MTSRLWLRIIAMAVAGLGLGVDAPIAQTAATTGPVIYRLEKDSTYQKGCFAPCLCPALVETPTRGTFTLTPTGFDGLFSTYSVTDVN